MSKAAENAQEDNKTPFDISIYPKLKKVDKDEIEREYYVVPDDIFNDHLKDLPDGTYNESKSFRAFHGGKLGVFGADPERDKEIQDKGREANKSASLQRRTFKQEADILLARIDKNNGKTGIENVTIAMYERAMAGDVKAYTALRDTAGEKPADTVDITANVMTEADQALIEKLKSRTGIQ